MNYEMKRPTYDWLLVMADGTHAVAHGRKSWADTQSIVTDEINQYARLSRGCTAEPTENGWSVYKGGQYQGSVRRIQKSLLQLDYQWEVSDENGTEWSPVYDLRAAAGGWGESWLAAKWVA
ncbi:MAG: hypothetical protein ACFB2W_00835 [Leptolyngbyaceae cyanobacterium]